jgi:hypothetical protein
MITGFVPPQSATSQQDLQISALTNQENLNPGSVGDAQINAAVDASVLGATGFSIGSMKTSVAPGDLQDTPPLSAPNSVTDTAKASSGNVAVIQAVSDKAKQDADFKGLLLVAALGYFSYKYFLKG